MESTEHSSADDPSFVLDSARDGGVACQGQVSPAAVVVLRVRLKCPEEVSLTERDDVVGALPSDRSDHSLAIWILPRTLVCRDDFVDRHTPELILENGAVDRVAVTNEESRLPAVAWEGLQDLSGGPFLGGVLGLVLEGMALRFREGQSWRELEPESAECRWR